MAEKKSKLLKTADKLQDFVLRHNEARDFIKRVLLLTNIDGLDQAGQIKMRAKVVPGAPAKFYAEFDGTKFCFRLGFGASTTKHDIDTVDVSKLPKATEDKVRVQLKNFQLT